MDMIKAPHIIKRYLARNYDMYNIPIGSNEVINNMQHLPENIVYFFAGNLIYLIVKNSIFFLTNIILFIENDQVVIQTSMYTGEKITRQTQISTEVKFLLFSVDSNLIQSLTVK